jgi:HK97 family phage major capsid protein
MQRNMEGRMALDRIAVQMRAIVDGAGSRGTKHLNSAEREKWNRLLAAYEKEEARVCASEGVRSLDEPSGRPRISDFSLPEITDRELRAMRPHARREATKTPEERAFTNFLRVGLDDMEEDDRQIMRSQFRDLKDLGIKNAQSTLVGSQGGVLVPQGFSDILTEAMLWFGGIDGVVGEFETASGNVMPWPTVNDTYNIGQVIGQNIQVSEVDFAFNQVQFSSYIISSGIVLVPIALVEDSYFDIDALTARLLGIRLGRALNRLCTIGTGSTEPMGIVTASVNAGNILTLPAGNTASIAYGNLISLEHSVDPSYRYNPTSRWMFSDTMLKLVKLLVDGNNRPLWQPGLTASFRDGAVVDLGADRPTILNHPYIINQDMPTPLASSYSMLFGDVSLYKLRKVAGGVTIQRLIERYADYLQIGFQGFMRIDGQLVDAGTHPIAVLQQSST